jgi:hypothetical protein
MPSLTLRAELKDLPVYDLIVPEYGDMRQSFGVTNVYGLQTT